MKENLEEFPIAIRLIDSQNNRISYKQLTLDEFIEVAVVLGTIKWLDVVGDNMKASCCYNKECPQQVNSKCIAGYKNSICKDRKASFNALDFIKSKQTLNKPIGKSTPTPRQ
ncbi:MAG: hypothetical protein E7208_03760 [Clostridium butyricum]|nr:hypothetical protein [Clostridium butyricum]